MDGVANIQISLSDGKNTVARLISHDPKTDLAIIKIDGKQPLPVIHFGGGGTPTSMVCGYLFCDDLPFNPVLASLPPLIRVPASGGPLAQWVEASVKYAMHASAERPEVNDLLLQRLPELLFMEALCDFARNKPDVDGWLAALVDPVVGRALACLHREPEHAWTLEQKTT